MSQPPLSFIEELKRRKVVRAATVYGAVTFVVVEVADLVFPALGFPAWTNSFVVVLALLGFPVALVLSWAFDLTPDGVQRTEPTAGTADQGGRRYESWISARTATVALVLVVGGWMAGRMSGGSTSDAAGPGSGGAFESIAVLPFTDMSPDGDQEYFGDGIAEELLNALAKIPNLKVAARTSAFSFKGQNPDIAMVAEALNVQTVLEGSIRKADNQLRITAQLIRADNGFHLWSETYDRPADDVFAVQDELARAIVAALRVQLTGAQEVALTQKGTDNVEAHNAYLLGRFQWNRRTEVGLRSGIESFSRAIELDSMYAEAYSGLSDANSILHQYGFTAPEAAHEAALAAARKAVELNPALSLGHRSLAWILMQENRDFEASEREFLRALELDADDAYAHYWYSWFLMITNRFAEAEREVLRARALDPLALQIRVGVGDFYHWSRQLDRSAEELLKVIDIDPTFAGAYGSLSRTEIQRGRNEEALYLLERYNEFSGGLTTRTAIALSALGQADEARELLEAEVAAGSRYVSPSRLAMAYAALGDTDRALDWLEIGVEAGAWTTLWMGFDWAFDPLRSEPRFQELMRRMGLDVYWPEGG